MTTKESTNELLRRAIIVIQDVIDYSGYEATQRKYDDRDRFGWRDLVAEIKAEAPTWSYFLEDYEGNVIKEVHNVPFQDAPRGAEEDDEGEILGHWHPFLPD